MMPHHQFYFIKYRWRRHSSQRWNHENNCIGEHPLHWLVSTHKDPEHYILDFYKEISAELFEKYKDIFD